MYIAKFIKQVCLGVPALALFCGVASADLLYLDSQVGLPTSLGPSTVAVTPHPLWQPNNPLNPGDPDDSSAVWISFADTGYGGSQFLPFQGTTPAGSVFHSFVSGPGMLTLNVWADDTADVLLDGNYLMQGVFTQSICSGQPIGCRPQDAGFINTAISGGAHTLEFVLYQVGTGDNSIANPFGLLYTGTVNTGTVLDDLPQAHAPEPGSWLLLGTLLCAAGSIKKFRGRFWSAKADPREQLSGAPEKLG